jgi:O-antigen biosynthesis protein
MADDFDVTVEPDDQRVDTIFAADIPHVIFTFGENRTFPELERQPLSVRRRWVHFGDPVPAPGELASKALGVFVDVTTRDRFPHLPLVSVFTPTYLSGERIERAFESLRAQTYTNWEWVLYDDSPGDDTWDRIADMRTRDARVKVFRSDRPSGRIGEVKRRCCGLTSGSILVELDHDDELLPSCLADVVEAFNAHPEAGFAYSDCAEIFENGTNASYGNSFAFGFGSYRSERYRGHDYLVTNYPSINAKTVRHIVGMPNHVRAWRRETYHAAGGHAPEVHVADDYELLLRTFLVTRFVHIKRFGYIQYLGNSEENTHRRRNREIQRAVHLFAGRFEGQIRQRFDELGVNDFIRVGIGLDWSQKPVGLVAANIEHL